MKNCSLCGGRLDANMRCTFCGLDNTKNDDMYKHILNQNDCGKGPLTHVHEEATRNSKTNTYSAPTYTSQRKKKSTSKTGVASVIGLIAVVFTLISSVYEIISEVTVDDYDYSYEEEINENPYEHTTYNLPENGMTYSVALEPGYYLVGTHIPEGTYTAEVVEGDYGMIEVQDLENSIYLYRNIGFNDEQTEVEDLRLYKNGILKVGTGVIIEITANNVQSTELITEQNSLTESYVIDGEAVAGEDFPAGVYNIVYDASNGEYEYGEFQYSVPMEDYDYEFSVFFDGSVGAETYHNVVLTKGTVINLEDLEEVTLVPCKEIPLISFEEYYKTFY